MKIYIAILAAACSLSFAAGGLAQGRQPPSGDHYARQIMEPDQLKKMKVQNAQGDEIGTVKQVLLDAAEGRIGYVVVTSGGFLGIGTEESIVPWSAVRFQGAGEGDPVLVVEGAGDRLLSVPHGDVQDMDGRYAELIHHYYGVAPYWEESQGRGAASPEQLQPMPPSQQAPAQPQGEAGEDL